MPLNQGWVSYRVLGLLLHCRGCIRKSSGASFLPCLASWCHSKKMGLPDLRVRRLATAPCTGATITTVKWRLLLRLWYLGMTKDQRADKDWSKETEDWALISAITYFCSWRYSITIVSRSQTLTFHLRVRLCKTTITSTWWWASNSIMLEDSTLHVSVCLFSC